jgi:hypothetical protein
MADITINGKFKDGDKTDHEIEIEVTKGEKEAGKKRRKSDKIRIKVDGNDITSAIVKGKKIKKKEKEDDEIDIDWISSEENNLGGWSGFTESFGLRVHCPKEGAKDDEPYVIIELTEKAHEEAKKAKEAKLPSLPEGEIRLKITEKDQKKLNKYFEDPELPKRVY